METMETGRQRSAIITAHKMRIYIKWIFNSINIGQLNIDIKWLIQPSIKFCYNSINTRMFCIKFFLLSLKYAAKYKQMFLK